MAALYSNPRKRVKLLENGIKARVDTLSGRADLSAQKQFLVQNLTRSETSRCGYLDYNQFVSAMTTFSCFGADAEQLFAYHDYSSQGLVCVEDFVAVMYGDKRASSLVNKVRPTPKEVDRGQAQLLVEKLRERVAAKGTRGIHGLGRRFKSMDDDGSGNLNLSEFKKALGEYSFVLSPEEVEAVFNEFDDDRSGKISFDEFLKGLRGPMNARRQHFVRLAFNLLDKDGSGAVDMDDIVAAYDTSKHPEVVAGTRSSRDVLREFLDTFDSENKDGLVSFSEFLSYYENVSASIDDDDYFELMMRNAWHISGGEGACANTTNRRVLVTHADGSQEVQEVKNDLGMDRVAAARAIEAANADSAAGGGGGGGGEEEEARLRRREACLRRVNGSTLAALKAQIVSKLESMTNFGLASKQKRVLLKVFAQFDADESGSLSLEEWVAALQQLNCFGEGVEALFHRFDADASGSVTYDEFADELLANGGSQF